MMKRNIHNKHIRGMTLLEILFTMTIFTVIIVAFFPLFSHTAKIITKSGEIIDAAYVASGTLERIYADSVNEETGLPADSVTEDRDEWSGDYWVRTEMDVDGRLVKVIVKVYSDSTKKTLESQMELHLQWHE